MREVPAFGLSGLGALERRSHLFLGGFRDERQHQVDVLVCQCRLGGGDDGTIQRIAVRRHTPIVRRSRLWAEAKVPGRR